MYNFKLLTKDKSTFNINQIVNILKSSELGLPASAIVANSSLQKNFTNVIMESMDCNTPVVAFDTGCHGDMITHKRNGYLAKPSLSDDLTAGIDWVLNNKQSIGDIPRQTVLDRFDQEVVMPQYIDSYKNMYE